MILQLCHIFETPHFSDIMPKRNKLITDTFKRVKKNEKSLKVNIIREDCSTDTITVNGPPKNAIATNSILEETETLKQFDINYKYGPCAGLTRVERWNRAANLGLNPPVQVMKILERNADNLDYQLCIWTAYEI